MTADRYLTEEQIVAFARLGQAVLAPIRAGLARGDRWAWDYLDGGEFETWALLLHQDVTTARSVLRRRYWQQPTPPEKLDHAPELYRCARCKGTFPASEMEVRPSRPDGVGTYCRPCKARKRRAYGSGNGGRGRTATR